MKIYLAASFFHRKLMAEWATEMAAYANIEVCSGWIHTQADDDSLTPEARRDQAIQDKVDLRNADIVVSYCPGDGKGRGGRHVEFGMAVALRKGLIVVGQREHVFHYLEGITFCANHHEAIATMLDMQIRGGWSAPVVRFR